jgi:inorganic pyrophosphatase
MSNLSLWHDIPLGSKAPEEFNAIIEIPRGSSNKYEIDKETGLIKLDRVNYSALYYPMDYGFAPQTYWPDKDPLDILVITTHPLVSGLLVAVRPIAGIEMIDDGDEDDKIITVPVEDPRFLEFQDLKDLSAHTKAELKHFFETSKQLMGKKVVVKSFYGKKTALGKINRAVKLYKDKFGG